MKFKLSKIAIFLTLFGMVACGGGGGEPTPEPEPEDTSAILSFHYWRKDGKFDDWNIWFWETGKDGKAFEFNGKDDWGAVATYHLSEWKTDVETDGLNFIVRKGEWSDKDYSKDLKIDFSQFTKDANNTYNIYYLSGDPTLYSTPVEYQDNFSMATFTGPNMVAINATDQVKDLKIYKNNSIHYSHGADKAGKVFRFQIPSNVDLNASYKVEGTLVNTGVVIDREMDFTGLYSTDYFGDFFNYTGDDLGANYSAASTTFKVWSPLSSKLVTRVYDSGTPGEDTHTDYEMSKGEKGVYSVTVNGDLAGKYYTYIVTNREYTDQEVVDPYAKSAGIDGVRGMIVDFSKTNPTGWDEVEPHHYDSKELTIYETHVADVTSSKTWTGTEANRKLFKGMYESGTTYTENGVSVKTGFDHIKELGVNAVQIVPLFDQANKEDKNEIEFNWGYNPLNYNVVEGGYSSNPYDGYVRIKEFKELVKAYNQAGINIIMDVVYNHVNSVTGLGFDVLMPYYYFRYDGNNLANGSGCGNETASENFMMRKFIVDSVKFWASEYKLGGFRFDLMGLHDLVTMEEVAAQAKTINPYITIFGEPWTGGTSPLDEKLRAVQNNGNKYVGYGAFNDQMRDALIKGGMNSASSLGWIDKESGAVAASDKNKIIAGIKGITKAGVEIADPDKTVNYVTCHDNYTLYDRFIATGKFKASDEEKLVKMNALANSVVFTSQGITFMLAGEEFLRTKGGDHNSYKSSYEVNELDYSLKIKHQNLFGIYQKLIALKQNVDGLHLDKDHISDVNPVFNEASSSIQYTIHDETNSREYKIIHVNGVGTDEKVNLNGYTLYLSTINANKQLSSSTALEPFETLIAYKSYK